MTRAAAGRLVALLAVMLLGLTGIFARLAVLQLRDQTSFRALGYEQRVHTVQLVARRGQIQDRNGQPLAISVEALDIYADPELVVDPIGEAAKIAPILGLKPIPLARSLSGPGTFTYLARQVDMALASQVQDLNLAGIGFLPSSKRSYPSGPLASQVIGFIGIDGIGLAGLEDQYDSVLAGVTGERTQEVGLGGEQIAQGVDLLKAPEPGDDLVLTIDRQLQYQAQAALQRAVEENHADGGTIIVMDPHTGDILAMASYPWFDPNSFTTKDLATGGRNGALVNAFEPGSVNKVITAAAAVEEDVVTLDERFTVPWTMQVGEFTIHDSHPHPVEKMTIGDILAQSSNIGAVQVARRVGSSQMSSYLSKFGFGRTTGLGFPGETPGDVPALSAWSDTTLATLAYGQGLSVSPMQMASVYATIANGGTWVQPRLVRGTVDPTGTFVQAQPSPAHEVVSPATARTVAQMLASVVSDGTGLAARIPGYQVAGKTGTALKPKVGAAGYYDDRYVASFIGFLPAGDPQVVVAAIIDEPTTIYGGVAAAPLFQHVAQYAIQRLGIRPGRDLPPLPTAYGHR